MLGTLFDWVLTDAGFEVDVDVDGASAFAGMQDRRYDRVLCDLGPAASAGANGSLVMSARMIELPMLLKEFLPPRV